MVNKMEKQITKLLEDIAKSFDKDLEKVNTLFEYAKEKIAAETGKTEPSLSVSAYHAVRAHLTKTQKEVGKEINVIFLGKNPSRDGNATLREEILGAFWNNPESRKKVIEQGKIMVLKVGNTGDFHNDYKPLSRIDKNVTIDGEFVPTEGELWDPSKNEDPICRDYRETTETGKENWNYSKPLETNWNTTLFGIGYFEDTPAIVKRVEVRFYGDSGNPKSGQFVLKHMDMFKLYKLKVQVNENGTRDNCYVLNAKTKPILAQNPGEDIDIIALIDNVNRKWEELQEAKGKPALELVPIVSLANLKQWHETRRAKRDDSGKILKSSKGWDLTNWDEYCLIDQCTYLGKRNFTENYTPISIQHDSTGDTTTFMNYDDDLEIDIPVPSDIVISVKTGRGTSKYDRESREKIENSDDPDLSITICGYHTLMSFEAINFPKELTGDW